MPKKQTVKNKKNLIPFAHPTKHGKLHWKKLVYIILTGVFILLMAAGATAQVAYNYYVNRTIAHLTSFQIRTLIIEAIEGHDSIKLKPTADMRIPEARLQLPAPTNEVRDLLYVYEPAGQFDDTVTGEKYTTAERIQVTTASLSRSGRSLLNAYDENNPLLLFERVPIAQACSRGFSLQFASEDNSLILTGTTALADGRTLYIYQEPACTIYGTDEFEAYLSKITSY
jgi:hypothetical protein